MQDGVSNINALVEQQAAKLKEDQQKQADADKNQQQASADQQQQNQNSQQQQADAGQQQNQQQSNGDQQQQNGDQGQQQAANDQQQQQQENPLDSLLKETNFESLDALKEFLKKKDEVQDTPEQLKKKQQIYEADLAAYAVKNDLLNMEDIQRLNSIKAMTDEDLVFKDFAETVKDEILEEMSEEDAEDESKILAAIKDKFENEFPVNSKVDKVRERAEAKLKRAAQEIRNPLESSFKTAKTRFDDEMAVRQHYPTYQANMKEVTEKLIPEKFNYYTGKEGDEEVVADVEITADDKKYLIEQLTKKIIDKPETFVLHKNGKSEDIKAALQEQLDILMLKRFSDAGKVKLAERYKSIGLKQGSDTGAKNSFANQSGAGNEKVVDTRTEQQKVIDSTRKKS